jgi:membrane-associated phospholipid phosphatase
MGGAVAMEDHLRSVPGLGVSLVVAVIGGVAFATAFALIRSGAVGLDERAFVALNRGPDGGTALARSVAWGTTPAVLAVLAAVACVVVAAQIGRAPLLSAAGAALFGWALANGAKLAIDRDRPYEAIAEAILRQDPARGTSFPSSHTAIVAAVVIALLPFVPWPWKIVGIALVVLVAWSRIYFGVHHPLDLLAGVGVGMVAAAASWIAVGALLRR